MGTLVNRNIDFTLLHDVHRVCAIPLGKQHHTRRYRDF